MKRAGLIASLCAAAVVAAGAGATLGQGAASSKPLRICVLSKTGQVSLVQKGKRCGHGSRAVTWNVRGRTGAQGAPGQPGARGATGTQGGRGNFDFDDFKDMPCDAGSGPDTVNVTYDSNGFATFRCGS
ncbi:MAG: hypothetical protein QOI32_910 [Thermoleophilaceae bacterium]|nr:hypothetical protein [Thermoleophilaceae bacterium]